MALWRDVKNALWHSFDALDHNRIGKVTKSRLKVLTASLGTLLHCHGVEKSLQDHHSTPYLSFEDYIYYLNIELPVNDLSSNDIRKYWDQIEEVCWLVCKQNYLMRDYVAFPDTCVFHLFRIFCLLGELKPVEESLTVAIDAEEVKYIIQLLTQELGQEWNPSEFEQVICVFSFIKFPVFLTLVETQITLNIERQGIIEATKEIYDSIILDVLKKGILKKRVTKLGGWWEYWYVLQPYRLSWYSSRDESDKRGEININPETKVEVVSDLQGNKNYRFTITTEGKTIELSSEDYKCKLQWMSAISTAIEYSKYPQSYQRSLATVRKSERQKAQLKKEKEETHRSQQLQELELEKKARAKAEALLKEESHKRKELEEAKKQYEKLLEEERQAKRDEEIVRTLQSRMLLEEWDKREQLEFQRAEQEKLLKEEQERRKELELQKAAQIKTVFHLSEKLSNLENEKCQLHNTLKKTKEKLVMSNCSSQTLQRNPKSKSTAPLQRARSVDLSCCSKLSTWSCQTDRNSFDNNCINIHHEENI
ncbi:switch-associated protein 70-like [Centruroides vittatus]|uniref:switch-associated protein 70-like n=1 Tax=Centruroides vittatus TaxID=120091 RepID=UPI00350EDD40